MGLLKPEVKRNYLDINDEAMERTPKPLLLSILGLGHALDALRDREAEETYQKGAEESEEIFNKFDKKRDELLFEQNKFLFSETINKFLEDGQITPEMKTRLDEQLASLTIDNEFVISTYLEPQGNSTFLQISGALVRDDIEKIIEIKDDIREFLEK